MTYNKLKKMNKKQLKKYELELIDKWLSRFLDGKPRKRLIYEIDKVRNIRGINTNED